MAELEPVVPPQRNLSAYDQSKYDALIAFIAGLLRHSFVLADQFRASAQGTMKLLETLVEEHIRQPSQSRLKKLVPSIGAMHTPLAFVKAFGAYDSKYRLTARTHVPPSEDEVRHILNLAQIFSSSDGLKFISFDGDETLYADGRNFSQSDASKLARYIEKLLVCGIAVALVTAAGYRGSPVKYEARLDGLLKHLESTMVPDDALRRFFVVGGECNYLFDCERVSDEMVARDGRSAVRLREVPDGWCDEHGRWEEDEVQRALDVATSSLRASAEDLALRTRVIRKHRAVGLISGGSEAKKCVPAGSGSRRVRRELLDECALRLQAALADAQVSLPTCCFNGGADVWMDIGHKGIGVRALQARLGVKSAQCLHVGDQFSTSIGNDFAARVAAPTLWVAGPKETQHVLKTMLEQRGISTKARAPPSWPPSTKRTSVFASAAALAAEQAALAAQGDEQDWVRG